MSYSKTCVKQPLSKRPKIVFQDQLSHNASQKYCRMLQREHSAILSTFIKLPFVIKIFDLCIFEWPFYTGFTVILISGLKSSILDVNLALNNLGDNCIQNFHLRRYIIGYTVWNFVLPKLVSRALKRDLRLYIWQYTSLNEHFEYSQTSIIRSATDRMNPFE